MVCLLAQHLAVFRSENATGAPMILGVQQAKKEARTMNGFWNPLVLGKFLPECRILVFMWSLVPRYESLFWEVGDRQRCWSMFALHALTSCPSLLEFSNGSFPKSGPQYGPRMIGLLPKGYRQTGPPTHRDSHIVLRINSKPGFYQPQTTFKEPQTSFKGPPIYRSSRMAHTACELQSIFWNAQIGVSKNQGPQYGPQNDRALTKRMLTKIWLILRF